MLKAGIGPDRQRCVSGRVGKGTGKEVGQGQRAVGMVVQRVVERAQSQRLVRMFHRSLVSLAMGTDQGAEAEGQSRIVVQREGPIEHLDGGVVIPGEVGADERADAHRLRVVAVDAQRNVGVAERRCLVGGIKPVAEVALLVAPCGVAVRCDIVRLELDRSRQQLQGLVRLDGRVRVRVRQCPKVEIVRIQAFRPFAARALDLRAPDARFDRSPRFARSADPGDRTRPWPRPRTCRPRHERPMRRRRAGH